VATHRTEQHKLATLHGSVCVAMFLVFFCAHCDPCTCHVAGVENVTVGALKLC
jgi:hypothetical protein